MKPELEEIVLWLCRQEKGKLDEVAIKISEHFLENEPERKGKLYNAISWQNEEMSEDTNFKERMEDITGALGCFIFAAPILLIFWTGEKIRNLCPTKHPKIKTK